VLADVRPFPDAGEKRAENHKALRSPANLVGLFAFWAFEARLAVARPRNGLAKAARRL
jgi:hypothetical protein